MLVSKLDTREEREWVAGTMNCCNPLDGILPGDGVPVAHLLLTSTNPQLRAGRERVGVAECYVIDAITDSGTYTVWLDPERSCSIVRARVVREGTQRFYGEPVAQPGRKLDPVLASALEPGDPGPPQAARSRIEFTLDDVVVLKMGELWVPNQAVTQTTISYEDGRALRDSRKIKRMKFDPAPDLSAPGLFKFDAPDGTAVAARGESHGVPMEWRGGRIIPRVDYPLVEQIRVEARQAEIPATIPSATSASGKSVGAWIGIAVSALIA
ncbi:MAG: hypothetical protein ACREJC_20375, partial [Tepidisphaeraceae bacterium]